MDLTRLLESQMQKQAVGTLVLSKDKRFREIFFEENQAYLAGEGFAGKVAIDKYVELGIVGERLPFAKLEALICSSDLEKNFLPDILHAQGLLEAAEIEKVARAQVLEEIADLFLHSDSSLHFQEGRVPERLLGSDSLVGRTPVPVGILLEELRRRRESSAGRDVLVPSKEEIFVITESGMSYKNGHGDDHVLRRTLDLIDGFRDLGSIIRDSYFFEFRIVSLIAKSLEEGHLKKTIHPELRGVSINKLSPPDAQHLLPFFKNAVKYGVDEIAARERLAMLFEKLGSIDDAVIQYNFVGDALFRMRKAAKAVRAYQKALALKPGEVLIINKISRIYADAAEQEIERGNKRLAVNLLQSALKVRPLDIDSFRRLADVLVDQRRFKELAAQCGEAVTLSHQTRNPDFAVAACLHAVQSVPREPAFRKRLINTYLEFGLQDKALAEMDALARLYTRRGEGDKAADVLERARRLNGGPSGGSPAGRRGAADRAGRVRRRRYLPVRSFVIVLLAFLGYQLWALFAWHEIRSAHGLSVAEGAVGEATSELLPGEEEKASTRRALECDRFLDRFPASLAAYEARQLRTESLRRLMDLRSQRKRAKQRTLEEASRLLRIEGAHASARSLLVPLRLVAETDPYRRRAEALLGQLEESGAPPASELLAEGDRLMGLKDWDAARRCLRTLVDVYPDSQAAADVRLPVLVRSLPPDASVRELGVDPQSAELGSRPVIHMAPGSCRFFELSRTGYEPLRIELFEAERGARAEEAPVFLLKRKPLWRDDLAARHGGRLAAPPTLARGLLFGGTTNGKLLCYDLDTGAQTAWSANDGSHASVSVPPVVAGDRLFTLWDGAKAIRLRFERGRGGTRPSLQPEESSSLAGLTTSPLVALERHSTPLVGTTAGDLVAILPPAAEKDSSWRVRIGSRPTVIVPLVPALETRSGTIGLLVATDAGTVTAIECSGGGHVLWQHTESEPISGVAPLMDLIAVTVRNHSDIVFLDPATGTRRGGVYLEDPALILLCPTARSALSVIRDGSGLAVISSRASGTRPEYDDSLTRHLRPPAVALFDLHGALGIAHNQGRDLLVADVRNRGAPRYLWSASFDERVHDAVADADHVAVSTTDGDLFLFRKED
jgi:tetratricopeptide (TPR) repeat protein